jgi:hypothetical protein
VVCARRLEQLVGEHISSEICPSRRQALNLPCITSQFAPIVLQQWEGVDNLAIKLTSREPPRIYYAFFPGTFGPANYSTDDFTYHPDLAHFEAGAHQVLDNNYLSRLHRDSGLLVGFSDNCLDDVFVIFKRAARANEVGSAIVIAVSDQENQVILERESSGSYSMWFTHVLVLNDKHDRHGIAACARLLLGVVHALVGVLVNPAPQAPNPKLAGWELLTSISGRRAFAAM